MDRKEIAMSADMAERLDLTDGRPVRIRAGARYAGAVVRVRGTQEHPCNHILLSPRVSRSLYLTLPIQLFLRAEPADSDTRPLVLMLGPLVGILVRGNLGIYRRYLRFIRDRNIQAFVFRRSGVRWQRRMIRGYFWTPTGWRRRAFPLPNVVYDRAIGGWQRERKGLFIQRLRKYGCITFNGPVGTKWSIHKRLSSISELRPALPATNRLHSTATLLRFVNRWKSAYLKPASGCWGNGIFRVHRLRTGRFSLRSSSNGYRTVVSKAGLRSLVSQLRRRGRYIVQQQVKLPRVHGAICDVRVLVLRDALGEWQIGGVVVRLGRRGRIVSNLHAGGRPLPLRPVLKHVLYPQHRKRIEDVSHHIRELALRIASGVETFAPYAGDLGIDLGLDRKGKVWLIEVNPKPGRRSFEITGGPDTRRRVYLLPFEYARYLAGFGPVPSPVSTRQTPRPKDVNRITGAYRSQ